MIVWTSVEIVVVGATVEVWHVSWDLVESAMHCQHMHLQASAVWHVQHARSLVEELVSSLQAYE